MWTGVQTRTVGLKSEHVSLIVCRGMCMVAPAAPKAVALGAKDSLYVCLFLPARPLRARASYYMYIKALAESLERRLECV